MNPNAIKRRPANTFAEAYERALLPLRRRDAGEQAAAASELDVAVGAGWYRLVCAVEALVEGLRRAATGARQRALRTHAKPRRDAAPLGCG